MMEVESASFEMVREGAPVTIAGFEFDSAVGRYAAPSSAEAVLQVRASDIAVQMGTISIGARTWLTNPLTNRWEELATGTGFNPATLFDPDTGWVTLLTDLTDSAFVATEGGAHHLTGTLPPARVETLTAGFAQDQSAAIDLWLDEDSARITRLEMSTTGEAGVSDWVITLSDYDQPVDIQPPPDG